MPERSSEPAREEFRQCTRMAAQLALAGPVREEVVVEAQQARIGVLGQNAIPDEFTHDVAVMPGKAQSIDRGRGFELVALMHTQPAEKLIPVRHGTVLADHLAPEPINKVSLGREEANLGVLRG